MRAIVLGLALCAASVAQAAPPTTPEKVAPVFTALQRNAWYLPTTDGAAKLFVTEVGTGEPVVFLHGGPGNDFHDIIDALAPHLERHRFILFDDRGSLMSPLAADKVDTATLKQLVEDLELLRVSTGQDQLTLFGHSFGSLLAMAYYEAYPARVKRIVLTGAFPVETTMKDLVATVRPLQKSLRERPAVQQAIAAEGLSGEGLTARQQSDKWRIANLAALNVVHVDRWRQVTGGRVFYNGAMDSRIGGSFPDAFDFRPTILAHPAPITVLQGDQDYLDRGAVRWKAFKAAHPEAPLTIEIMPEASHYAWIDAPGPFAKGLAKGLGR